MRWHAYHAHHPRNTKRQYKEAHTNMRLRTHWQLHAHTQVNTQMQTYKRKQKHINRHGYTGARTLKAKPAIAKHVCSSTQHCIQEHLHARTPSCTPEATTRSRLARVRTLRLAYIDDDDMTYTPTHAWISNDCTRDIWSTCIRTPTNVCTRIQNERTSHVTAY